MMLEQGVDIRFVQEILGANREGPVGVITEVAATTGAIAAGLLKLWLAF